MGPAGDLPYGHHGCAVRSGRPAGVIESGEASVQEPEAKDRGVPAVLEVLRRRQWLGLAVFAGLFAPATAFVAFLPDLYRATSTVLVERQPVPESFVQPSVTDAVDTRLHTISQEILSRARLGDLIERFNLYPELRDRASPEDLTQRMRLDIDLTRKEVEQAWGRSATIAFALSYRGKDPQRVAQVTNALAAFYVEENVKLRERQAARTAEFLKTQLQEMKRKLDGQEARAGEFKERHPGELPQQVEANLATLERLNAQLNLNSQNQMRAIERRDRLERQRAGLAPGVPAADAESPAGRLSRLNRELADLRTRYTPLYPDIVRLEREIEALKKSGAASGTAPGRDPAPAAAGPEDRDQREVDADMSLLKAEEARLREAIARYEQRVENAPRRQQELDEVSRDYRTTKDLYDSLLKKYEEALLAQSLEHGQTAERFRILDPALPPQAPEAPGRVWLGVVILLMAAGAAAGAMMVAERADTSIHGAEALRAFTRVPVLVSIPLIVTRAEGRWRRLKRAAMLLAAAGMLAALTGLAYRAAHQYEQIVYILSRVRS